MYINLFGLICQSFSGNFFYIFDDNTKTPCTSTERFAKMYVVRSSPQWRNRNRWIRTTSMLIHESAVLPLNYIPKLLPGCRLALAACCKKEPCRLCAFGFYCIVQRTFRIIRTFFFFTQKMAIPQGPPFYYLFIPNFTISASCKI